METVLIQIISPGTMNLLHELEDLKILRILKKDNPPDLLLSEKYAGKLPAGIADDLQNHIEKSRNEWNSSI
jgi:hypothetical protein